MSRELTWVPLPQSGFAGWADSAGDRPANPVNTRTSKLNLTQCLLARFGPASLGPAGFEWGLAINAIPANAVAYTSVASTIL